MVFEVSHPPLKRGSQSPPNHQIRDIFIFCDVFASVSAVFGTFYPSPREAWNSGWGLLVLSALGGDRIVYLGVRRGFFPS
jgi:hypothetical protein